jgi:hypothetical protein
MNLATCFASLSHHQANSQTMLKVRSVDVHIVGSQIFTNPVTLKGINVWYPVLYCVVLYYKTQPICRNRSILYWLYYE